MTKKDTSKLMHEIRDFFFPMIDKPSDEETQEEEKGRKKQEQEIKKYPFRNDEADIMLTLAEEYEKREDARLHEVESKAIVFIGTFSVTSTILMSLLKDFLLGSSNGIIKNAPFWFEKLIVFLLALSIFYLCFAIIYSIKTLQRGTFNVLGVKDILDAKVQNSIILVPGNEANKNYDQDIVSKRKIRIARKKLVYTYRNEDVINKKVDNMTLAQSYFKHAVCVLMSIVILLVIYLIFSKTGAQIGNWLNSVMKLIYSGGGGNVATPSGIP